MNCILVENNQAAADGSISLNARQSKHVVDVLKKKIGDSILAGVVNGPMGIVPIVEITNGIVKIGTPYGPTPLRPPVDLILAMPRPKVMKRLWAPLASMGIQQITVIGAERVEPFYFESHALNEDVFRTLMIEGLEQARDTHLPAVQVVKSFSWFAGHQLTAIAANRKKLLGQPGAHESVRQSLHSARQGTQVTLAVGPEGGWTQNEIDAFALHGFIPVSMRDRALRTDTAIISLLALVYDALQPA